MRRARYFVVREKDGSVSILARIRWDDEGITGEYVEDGHWIEDRSMTDFMIDPSIGEEVSSEVATEIAIAFGGMPEPAKALM